MFNYFKLFVSKFLDLIFIFHFSKKRNVTSIEITFQFIFKLDFPSDTFEFH